MKVALVVPGGVDRSGTERVIPCLLWLIERLVRAGDEVHVFALRQEPAPGGWQLLGATIHNAGRSPRRLRAIAGLAREHRRGPFDVIHAFWVGKPGQVASAFATLAKVPFVVTLPGGDLAAIPDIGYGGQLRWRGRIAARMVLSRASAIVVPTEWMAKQAEAKGLRTLAIPFGVALDRWPPSLPRPRRPNGPLNLIHVASLNPVKEQFALLDAMRLLTAGGLDFQLDIIGEDTLGGAVQRRCRALGLDQRVAFHGFVANHDLRPWVDRADLLVMSSRHEGAAIVVLEAAASGVPTVGTATGIVADWSPDASVAIPVSNPTALAEAITKLAQDEPERLRLAASAQLRATTHDADAYTRRIRELYARVSR